MADKFQKNKFFRVPEDTFNHLIKGSGVVLKNFDTETLNYTNEDFLCATSGGIKVSSTMETSDRGEQVDNVKKNTKELAELSQRTHTITFTAKSATTEMVKRAVGAADLEGTKLVLRNYLENKDFAPLWIVFGKTNGGAMVAHFPDTLSTGGLDFSSSNDETGSFNCTFTAYSSLQTQDVDAVEYYIIDPPEETADNTRSETTNIDNILAEEE